MNASNVNRRASFVSRRSLQPPACRPHPFGMLSPGPVRRQIQNAKHETCPEHSRTDPKQTSRAEIQMTETRIGGSRLQRPVLDIESSAVRACFELRSSNFVLRILPPLPPSMRPRRQKARPDLGPVAARTHRVPSTIAVWKCRCPRVPTVRGYVAPDYPWTAPSHLPEMSIDWCPGADIVDMVHYWRDSGNDV